MNDQLTLCIVNRYRSNTSLNIYHINIFVVDTIIKLIIIAYASLYVRIIPIYRLISLLVHKVSNIQEDICEAGHVLNMKHSFVHVGKPFSVSDTSSLSCRCILASTKGSAQCPNFWAA